VAEGDQALLGVADDDFHEPVPGEWWSHETCWFWFFVPEKRIGSWIYNWIRPNIGTCGGGLSIWDDRTSVHWEVPYFSNYSSLRLPEQRDLRAFTFPTGISVEMLEPLSRYRIRYANDEMVHLDLEFAATMPPWVSAIDDDDGRRPHHFDQFGRVTGTLVLHGEPSFVDCLAIRDRTWAVRSERWKHGGGFGYTSAAADSGESFLFVGDTVRASGFVVLDGRRAELVAGARRVERDHDRGHVTRVVVEARDDEGRRLLAEGRSVSRIAMPVPGVHGVVWASLCEWTINGVPAWGDDQEPWPIMAWSNRRRA
jgi:hypothetical protein